MAGLTERKIKDERLTRSDLRVRRVQLKFDIRDEASDHQSRLTLSHGSVALSSPAKSLPSVR